MTDSEQYMSESEFTDMMLGHVHPVILSSEHIDGYYSHGGIGTAFVLEFCGELFVVTALHVLRNQFATHDELRILLRNAPLSILFDLRAVFRDESDPDPDSDLVILRIVKSQHAELYAAGLVSLDAAECAFIEDYSRAESFDVFGYPETGRSYDYEENILGSQLRWLKGELTESTVQGLCTLKIKGQRPGDFNGMSGSLVIADVDGLMRFAGLVTLASNEGGILNFIPAEKIVHHLDEMLRMELAGVVEAEDSGSVDRSMDGVSDGTRESPR
ncbi:hypothetical protein [Pseudomonas sp. PSKL.D1]|uniref:hypothetical protein n=1 Tax=Pseudomonas sp. PSKL.D1 TaxID=3029060 RepID=UPI0023811320|nr:hypothetical protein [Pseudomonas sp. PSKL.D1]WDY56574.1 hypothetical protein PVV54_18545 [Pseudomonas sp. PSKL.D1]